MRPLRIALVYDVFDAYPWRDGDPPDADAEYEPWETVEALEEAFRALGHTPIRVGTAHDLLRALPHLNVDAALSIAEGAHSINREGYAPTLFEMAGIPFLGSDALTLSVSLDKAWTRDLVAAAGVRVPWGRAVSRPEHLDALPLPAFPLFVKPRFEGSAKGITAASKVNDLLSLRDVVQDLVSRYRQDVLVEQFIAGTEWTVAVVGNDPARALPVLQRAVEKHSGIGLHVLERKGIAHIAPLEYEIESVLTPALEQELQSAALTVFETLRCKDFARMDFRVSADGTMYFLEVNPLPTFAPDGTFAILAELAGKDYPTFLAEVLHDGLVRLGLD